MAASFQIEHPRKRTTDYTVVLYEVDGSTGIVLAATDVVRFKAYIGDQATPNLELSSISANANGGVVTVTQLTTPATVTVRLAQEDTDIHLGAYDCEILVSDDSETAPADAAKSAMRGVLVITRSGGGDIGLT